MRWRATRSLAKQQFAGPTLEPAQVDPLAVELHPPAPEVGDLADGHEEVPPADAHDGSFDWRMGPLPHSDDEVLHPAQTVAVLVDQRALDHARQVDDWDVAGGDGTGGGHGDQR